MIAEKESHSNPEVSNSPESEQNDVSISIEFLENLSEVA